MLGLVLAAGALASCANETNEDGEATTVETDVVDDSSGVETDEAASGSGEAGAYPLTVEICGREWTYDERPSQVVTTDSGMLDLMLALGLQDEVTGWFGGRIENLDPAYADQAAQLDRLGDGFPYPTLESILASEPDLVLSYGYNDEAGFTPDRLIEEGINNFTVTEGCDNFTGASTLDTFYEDVRTLAAIFDVEDAGEELIESWEGRVEAATALVPEGDPVTVLNTGSGDPAAPFASARDALVEELIVNAGGENIFADTDGAYFSPSWEEVVARDPELIIESSGFGEEGLDAVRAHLEANPALATMTAVQEDNFVSLRYEEGVPGTQFFNGLEQVAEEIAEIRGA